MNDEAAVISEMKNCCFVIPDLITPFLLREHLPKKAGLWYDTCGREIKDPDPLGLPAG